MTALVAWRHNPAIRAFCERLQANGKNGKAIIACAAMRKLMHIAFAVLKSGQPFGWNYLAVTGMPFWINWRRWREKVKVE
jgi:hypothetical protein